MYVRIPNRSTSKLYMETPEVSGMNRLAIDGVEVKPRIEKGYAVITREWKAGDRIDLDLPMQPQRVKADKRIAADAGLVALRYGPLIYSIETADQSNIDKALSDAPLQMEWKQDLFGGTLAMTGKWEDGTPMLAIPNYARMNRAEQPKEQATSDSSVNYAPGSTVNANAGSATHRRRREIHVQSKVWIKDQI
jgi:DUF1680 family protein